MFYVISLLISNISTVLNGFVLKILYDWYLLKPFNFPEIKLIHAIGIFIIIKFITEPFQKIPEDTNELKKQINDLIINNISKTLAAFIVGWVFHFFI